MKKEITNELRSKLHWLSDKEILNLRNAVENATYIKYVNGIGEYDSYLSTYKDLWIKEFVNGAITITDMNGYGEPLVVGVSYNEFMGIQEDIKD